MVTSLRQTPSAGTEGVHLKESWLQGPKLTFLLQVPSDFQLPGGKFWSPASARKMFA